MCYSAQLREGYKAFIRHTGASISIRKFAELYGHRYQDRRIKIPKCIDQWFSDPQNDEERQIYGLIREFNEGELNRLEQDLFAQRTRLVEAERKLQSKPTKAATESARIAGTKIKWALRKIAEIKRTEPDRSDSRIFPGYYAPVIIHENGEKIVVPMRYQCRPAGKPAFYDTKYPGTYNARRDNLEGFWRDLFGYTHGIMVVSAFYENVSRHKVEGRELAPGEKEENVVLEFDPSPPQDMLVACLWSKWTAPGEPDLYSFAAITDEPPPEVAAAGHDRCIIPIKPENVDAWLNPDAGNLKRLYEILDDRDRPYYEHRLAA